MELRPRAQPGLHMRCTTWVVLGCFTGWTLFKVRHRVTSLTLVPLWNKSFEGATIIMALAVAIGARISTIICSAASRVYYL